MPMSCHPSHIFNNILKGVMKCIKRNCSNEAACKKGYSEYSIHLAKWGHGPEIIKNGIVEAEYFSRKELIGLLETSKASPSPKWFPLIVKFNPRLPPVSNFIRKHTHT